MKPAGVDEATREPIKGDEPEQRGVAATSDVTWNAEVRQYNADDLPTAVHQPWGGTDTRRFRSNIEYDGRGRATAVESAYDWSDPAATTSRTTYTHLDSGWIRTQSEPQVVDPDNQTHYAQTISYEYDTRGNQLYWASNHREICNRYGPNSTLSRREATPTNAGRKCKNGDPASSSDEPLRVYAYTYDNQRQMRSMTDLSITSTGAPARTNSRQTTFSYDAADRQAAVDETWTGGRDTQLFYDRNGNVTERRTDGAITAPGSYSADGRTTSSTYDSLDRETLNRVRTPNGSGGYVDRVTTSAYFPSGEKHYITKPNGEQEERRYDDAMRLTFLSRSAGGRPKMQSYSYDRNGNRAEDERGRYTFNARDELVRWERGGYGPRSGVVDYKLNGNGAVVEKRDSHDGSFRKYRYAGDRLESIRDGNQNDAVLTDFRYHDAPGSARHGQLDRIVTGTRTETYEFDEFDRMTRFQSGATDRRYAYDGLDRRDAEFNAGAATPALELSYIGGSEQLSREHDAGTGRTNYYDYDADGERIGQTSRTNNGAPTSVTYGKDAGGSVESVGTGRCRYGESQDCYFLDPYGNQEGADNQLSAQAAANPFRFQGHYRDAASGTYDMRARQYRPDGGTFLQADRYEAAQLDFHLQTELLTQNRYAFAAGNPVSNVEFDGHFFPWCKLLRYIDKVVGDKPRKCRRRVTEEEIRILEINADFLARRVGRVEKADPAEVRRRPGFRYAVVAMSLRRGRVSSEGARLLTSIDPTRNASSRKLWQVIRSNYRAPKRGQEMVGPKGSTADAIYREIKTGRKVGGRWHRQKGEDSVRALQDVLKNSDKLTAREIEIAQRTLNQLKDALKGRPPKY